MRKVVVEVGEDGRIIAPPGTRLRLSGEILDAEESTESAQERSKKLQAVFEEIDARLDSAPRQPWPKNDPIVEKFRRMGILEED